jgi:hypothetical protein
MVHDTVPAFPQVSFTLQNITVEAAFRGNNLNDRLEVGSTLISHKNHNPTQATLDDEQTSE